MTTRREFLTTSAALAAGGAVLKPAEVAAARPERSNTSFTQERRLPPGMPGRDYTPVVTPNGATLPWKIVDGVKVYHPRNSS